jgi:hypothetical protein
VNKLVTKKTHGRLIAQQLTANRSRPSARLVHSVAPHARHVLLSKIIEFLLSTGESPEVIAIELEAQAQRVKGLLPLSHSNDAKQVQDGRVHHGEVAGVVHDWHREPAYTNQEGEPVHLTHKALRALVGKRFSRQRVPATIRWMLKNGVVKKTHGRVALGGGRRTVVTKGVEGINRAAGLVPQYLQVALRNAETKDNYSCDIDREARVFFLPEKYVPLWRAVARERAQAFVGGIDNWLEDHARRDDAGPVREVAMHCYSYTGDSRLPKAARARSHQLRARRR